MKKELRHVRATEVRGAQTDADTFDVTVRFAVTNEWTDIGGFRERITPGAFKEALPRSDVFFLIEHEGAPLARSKSKTLELHEDEDGLVGTASLDLNNPRAQEVKSMVERGDLENASFAFSISREGQKWDGDDRTITRFEALHDVSLVSTGAYETPGVMSMRSADSIREARAEYFSDSLESDIAETKLRQARLRVHRSEH